MFGSNWRMMLTDMERLIPQHSCPSDRTRLLSAGKPREQSWCESSAEAFAQLPVCLQSANNRSFTVHGVASAKSLFIVQG